MTRIPFVAQPLALLLLPITLAAGERIHLTSTETIPFRPRGVIQIDDSFGDLHIEAWDRDEVAIEVNRRTQRRYDARDRWKGEQDLERIRIETRVSGDRVEIRTRFPNRGLFRMLRGKSNVDLRYNIKVPRKSHLRVRHDIGEVEVIGVEGDHDVAASIGEVNLRLPDAEYHFSARARIGEITSSYHGRDRREHFLGARFDTPYRRAGYRVDARVGIGEVRIDRVK